MIEGEDRIPFGDEMIDHIRVAAAVLPESVDEKNGGKRWSFRAGWKRGRRKPSLPENLDISCSTEGSFGMGTGKIGM